VSPGDRHAPLKAMIMAAGLGTRLAPLTDRTAKPMAPIVDRPAMEHILRLLARHGVTEVFVNLHHHAAAIRDCFGDGAVYGLGITYNLEEKLMGTAGGVGGFRDKLASDTFVVVSGDALTDADLSSLVSRHRARGSLATVAVKPVDDPSHYGVVVHDADDHIVMFQEKPPRDEALSDLCNCGIYAFEPGIFDYVPPGEFVDWAKDVFPRLLAERERFHIWRLESYWNDIGSIAEYRRGNFDALNGRVGVEMPGHEVRPGIWVGDGTEIATGAVIEPPVLIGGRCSVQGGARLVGPLVVGDGCFIGADAALADTVCWQGVVTGRGATVTGAIVGPDVEVRDGATVQRGAVLADGCVIEAGAAVGADARLAADTVVAGDGVPPA